MIALKTHILPSKERPVRRNRGSLPLCLRQKFDELVLETIGSSPAEFAADIQAEILRWTPARPQLR